MKSKSKGSVTEKALSKALDELEGSLKKGSIPEEMKNANGGLATEGKDLADEISASETQKGDEKPGLPSLRKAKKKKGMPAEMSDDSSSEEESPEESGSEDDSDSMSKAGSEDGSDEVEKKYSASDESSSAESMSKGGEESSSSSSASSMSKSKKTKKSVRKSFKDRAERNADIKKALDVSSFLENFVDQISDRDAELTKALENLQEGQGEFNGKLTKALILIGRQQAETSELVKSLVERLENTPESGRVRKSLLSKSEVQERFEGDGDLTKADHTDPTFRSRISALLLRKAERGEINPALVTAYESGMVGDAGDLAVVKSCEEEILKKSKG